MGTPLDSFLPEIARLSKDVPEPTQTDALLRAARQFCFETWFVNRLLSITCEQYVSLYQLPVDAGEEEIIFVQYASVTQLPNGGTLPMYPTPITNPNNRPQLPRNWAFVQPSAINLIPKPDKAYPVQVMVIIQPTATATTLPTELFKDYARTIGYGALAWIYAMPGEVWTNPAGADRMARAFAAGINNGKTQALRRSLPGITRATPRRWIL